MATKSDPATAATAAFPFPELDRIAELNKPPTYITLLKLQSQLSANASAVITTQGTGLHGHVVLTLTRAAFYQLTGTLEAAAHPHPAPANPGHIEPQTTTAQARVLEQQLYHYKLYMTTEQLLKKALIAATPDLYITKLKHIVTNYATVSTIQLLTHLWDTYGTITAKDLDINLTTMSKTWHPSEPIETLFDNITQGVAFALAGESPLHDSHVVRIAYNVIEATGVFEIPCREWRNKAKDYKTYANVQTFFIAANKDRLTTTSSVGYHSSNAVTNDKDTIAALTKSNLELKTKLTAFHKAKDSPQARQK